MKSNKGITRTFGIFFILAFASYGLGTGLSEMATRNLTDFAGHENQLIFGVILMALVHTVVNIGLPVLMVPTLKSVNKVLSLGYLSAGVTATIVVLFGALLLLLHVPLSTMYQGVSGAELEHFKTIATLLVKGNFYAYQLGMALWAVGGLMLCYLLFQSQLVPRFFAIWGFIGYLVFMAGTLLEIFGFGYGVELAIPGGLFELSLSFWLIFKGFNQNRLAELNPSY